MKLRVLIATCVALSFSLSAYAQRSPQSFFDELAAAGYPDTEMKVASFLKTKQRYTVTALYKTKTDKNPRFFYASVAPTKDGASVGFKESRSCIPNNDPGRLQERIIMVNGQKIETYLGCVKVAESETQEIYAIKSPEGAQFVQREFATKDIVFVHLRGLPVPFLTEGFSQVLAEASGKAL
jgi:hypothetical protein